MTAVDRGLDQLDEDAAGVLGVDEVDPAVRRAATRGVVQEPQAALAQDRRDLLDVGDPVGELLHARTGHQIDHDRRGWRCRHDPRTRLVQRWLQRSGHSVRDFSTNVEALTLLKRHLYQYQGYIGAATVYPIELDEDLIDQDAAKVVKRLVRAGYEAYLVGGCVRDLLLDIDPKDFDVATSATPEQVRAEFRNARVIGRRFKAQPAGAIAFLHRPGAGPAGRPPWRHAGRRRWRPARRR